MRKHRTVIVGLVQATLVAGALTYIGSNTSEWIAAIFAVPALLAFVAITVTQSVRRTKIEPVDRFAEPYMTSQSFGQFDQQAALEALAAVGFTRAGAVQVTTDMDDSVYPLLLSADRQTFAVATNHLVLTSEYDGKLLCTSTSGLSAPSGFELTRAFPRTEVNELLARHHEMVDQILITTGKLPRQLDSSTVVDVFVKSETANIQKINTGSQILAMIGVPFRGRRRDPLERGATQAILSWLDREDDYRIA